MAETLSAAGTRTTLLPADAARGKQPRPNGQRPTRWKYGSLSWRRLSASAPGGLSDRDIVGAKGRWTPQAGALLRVAPGVLGFVTYGESIDPDFQLDADGSPSEPVESRSFDAGVKLDALDGRLAGTIALYQINRANLKFRDAARESSTGRAPYFVYGNSERSKGIEFDLSWSPTANWQALAGWHHFFAAETTRSNQPARVGARLPYTPGNTFFAWGRYTVSSGALRGFGFGAGLRHNDAARISNDPNNVVENPAFTVYDAAITYAFDFARRRATLQLNIKNAFDKLHREGPDGFFDTRRQIFLSLRTRF